MSKRQRTDTGQGVLNAMADALTEVQPPDHCRLRERDWPFWQSIVSARAASAWTITDLENAAHLARTKADIERIQDELENENDIVENARGTQIVNPKYQLLETLSRRAMALSRMLHVHAEATGGKAGKESKRNGAAAGARKTLEEIQDDDLIPTPTNYN